MARPPRRPWSYHRDPGRGLRRRGHPNPGTGDPRPRQPRPRQPRRPSRRCRIPTAAEVDCAAGTYNGKPYTGMIKSIKAIDALTVEFTLCGSDPAFLSKVAFSPFAINDTAYLEKAAADGSIVRTAERDRPVQAQGVGPGRPHHPRGQPDLLGRGAEGQRGHLPLEHRGRPAARRAPVRQRRRDRQPGPDGLRDDQERPEPQALPARRPERLLRGHEQHVPAVRQRQGPPGGRDGHRPAADRRQLHAARLVRSRPTSRRARSRTAASATSGTPSTWPPPRRSSPRPASPTASRPRSTSATSSAATWPSRSSWPRTSRPSSRPT